VTSYSAIAPQRVDKLPGVSTESFGEQFQTLQKTKNERNKCMHSHKINSNRWQHWLVASSLLVATDLAALAQPSAQLIIQTYAGLTITGSVGTVYSMEYMPNLLQTNSWHCLEFLRLPASPYTWLDKSSPANGRRFYRAVSFAAPTNMVFIPPGSFRMGSPSNEVDRYYDEGPQTEVTLTRGFWMGQYLVTQQEYQAVMGRNPSGFPGDPTRPVEGTSWYDAVNYCNGLTRMERSSGRIPTNAVYRLATEAEWEYACRALTSTRFSYGDDPSYSDLGNYAWWGGFFGGNGGMTTHPVGQKLPNPWGLYDMHSNVYEWCQDWYGGYPGGAVIDPQGPATGTNRVNRGGSWAAPSSWCRSAFRLEGNPPEYTSTGLGLRVVLAQGVP
jgi:formylglycine-generating enzyme required for sulfatase activity